MASHLVKSEPRKGWTFSDIKTGDQYWLSADKANARQCLAHFDALNIDGKSRNFTCVNGGWEGTLISHADGRLELVVLETRSQTFVQITEKIARFNPYD